MSSGCRILGLLAAFMILSVTVCPTAGADSITIHYSKAGHEKRVAVPLDEIGTHNDVIRTVDPNFKEDGPVKFSGIALKHLPVPEQVSFDKGFTVVGHDQYIGFVSPSAVKSGAVIAACRMAGSPIPPGKGGPLKIIYAGDMNMPLSAYTWYVRAVYAGRIDNPVLSIRDGREVLQFRHVDLAPVSEKLEKRFFSTPAGFRGNAGGESKSSVEDIRCVPVARLFEQNHIRPERVVEFIPSAGPSVKVPARFVNHGIKVIYKTGDKALHPVFGGPYSVIFPIEKYPEMMGRVPESGALFFVKQIAVH
ncbi:MAG: hypothetical protein K9J83_05905 [Desulfarculaceae bacterium]|nr:hypothetical protein [Desulfarculaceae bacterium]